MASIRLSDRRNKLARAGRHTLLVQNDGHKSVQILVEAQEGVYKLSPGDTVEIALSDLPGQVRLCVYDGGLQVAGTARAA